MKRSTLSNAHLKVIKLGKAFGKWIIEGWEVIARLPDGWPYW